MTEMNLSIYTKQNQTCRQGKQTCGCQRGEGQVGWINTKALLWSTGNSVQYPVINHHGKESEKECACVRACVCVCV